MSQVVDFSAKPATRQRVRLGALLTRPTRPSTGSALNAGDLEQYGDAAWWLQARGGDRAPGEGLRSLPRQGKGARRRPCRPDAVVGSRGSRRVRRVAGGSRRPNGFSAVLSDVRPSTGAPSCPRGLTALMNEGDLLKAIELLRQGARARQPLRRPRHQVLALVGEGRALIKRATSSRGSPARRGDRGGGVRRAAPALDRARLLHHDQLLPGPRRLPARRGVDGRGEPLVRPARRDRLPGACRIHRAEIDAAARRLAGGRGQAIAACEELHDFERAITGRRALRDRRDPAPPRRLRGRRGGVRAPNELGATRSPGSRSATRRGQGRRGGRGHHGALDEPRSPPLRLRRLPRRSRSRSRRAT